MSITQRPPNLAGNVDINHKIRIPEIINGYTVTFEDGLYSVNLIGSNNNIPDVLNLNQVSVRSANSAGLITINTSGGVGTVTEVANAVWNAAQSSYVTPGSMGKALSTAGNAADPWAVDLTSYNTANTAGKIVKDAATQSTLLEIQNDVNDISVSSAAINSPAISINQVAGSVVSGTYLDTQTQNGISHVIRDVATAFDFRYTFNIDNGIPSLFTFNGSVADTHEVARFEAWNTTTNAWDVIGLIPGSKNNAITTFAMYAHHVATNGDVIVRITSNTISDIIVTIDQMFVSYSTVAPSAIQIADQVRTELTPELTHLMLMENGLTSAQATMLTEIYRLYGLDPTKPLIVTDTSRTAGAGLTQAITSTPTQTTVQRV